MKYILLPALVLAVFAPMTFAGDRAASVYLSQDFINEQLALHSKSEMLQDLKIVLDPQGDRVLLKGIVQVPLEELRAVNLDPKLGKFRFQLAIQPQTSHHGHLILEFPLNETYFYPADSTDLKHDRVIIPVQMLSLALASARGYLAALSGDFKGFDRRTEKLDALMRGLDRQIETEKNADALDDLKNQRDSLRLQIAAIPLERKQLLSLSKELATMIGFTGEKELNLNDELKAKKNALVLKLKLSQLTPYLSGVELGGVRILHDKKDGIAGGQNYLSFDINADQGSPTDAVAVTKGPARAPMKIAPSLIMRLNQSLFESEAVLAEEKKSMGSKLENFDMSLKEDGLHVSGKYHELLFSIPFDTVVKFVWTAADTFEVRVGELKIAGLDFEFLTGFVLETMKRRLDQSFKGMCEFKYLGDEKNHDRALQVSVSPEKLVPAFPSLHLIGVDVREREFLLKIGHI
jgi:hypothetical protein